MTPATVEAEILLDVRADLGEGPIWHPERRLLSWVDLYAGTVNWLGLDGTAGASVGVGRCVGSALPTRDDALMLSTDEGFIRLAHDGSTQLIAAVEADRNSFLNDGKCDALGRLWAGTVGVGEDGLATPAGGALYRLDVDGSVACMLPATTLSNGMDWSRDGETFFYVDSGTATIDAFDFDLIDGAIRRRRAIIEIPAEEGFADGICADVDGCIWAAVWGAAEVRRYTPAGVLDRTVLLPVSQPTSVIFAGENLDVLVITSASHLLSADERSAQPHAGSVFCARPGVSGSRTHSYGAPAAAAGAQ
jgi:sugar lactone lactonase YvrE